MGPNGHRAGAEPGAIDFLEALPEVTFSSRRLLMSGFIYSSCR